MWPADMVSQGYLDTSPAMPKQCTCTIAETGTKLFTLSGMGKPYMQNAHWRLHFLDPLRVGVDVKPGGEVLAAWPHLPQTCTSASHLVSWHAAGQPGQTAAQAPMHACMLLWAARCLPHAGPIIPSLHRHLRSPLPSFTHPSMAFGTDKVQLEPLIGGLATPGAVGSGVHLTRMLHAG
jgi:hypothetical protein